MPVMIEFSRRLVDRITGRARIVDESRMMHTIFNQAFVETLDFATLQPSAEVLRLIEARLARNRGLMPIELQDSIEIVGYIIQSFAVDYRAPFGKNKQEVSASIAGNVATRMLRYGRNDSPTTEEDLTREVAGVATKMQEAGLIARRRLSGRYTHGIYFGYLHSKADALLQQ
jgi:hypothetical protein